MRVLHTCVRRNVINAPVAVAATLGGNRKRIIMRTSDGHCAGRRRTVLVFRWSEFANQ